MANAPLVYETPPFVGPPLARDDVLPVAPPPAVQSRRAWAAAVVASVARTWWLAVVLAAAFLGGAVGTGMVRHQQASAALGWGLAGAGAWLGLSAVWIALRRRAS